MAFFGSALLLATEWAEVFLVRTLALRVPDALQTLDAGHGLNGYDWGALIALGMFALGWIALAASTFRTGMLSRGAAALVIAGFFATPLLGAALPGAWGAVVGNGILGLGWFWLGSDLRRLAATRSPTLTTPANQASTERSQDGTAKLFGDDARERQI
jgi:hypothetical protein